MVGLVRFELTTSCTPCKRATRLRYSPNKEGSESSMQPAEASGFFDHPFGPDKFPGNASLISRTYTTGTSLKLL